MDRHAQISGILKLATLKNVKFSVLMFFGVHVVLFLGKMANSEFSATSQQQSAVQNANFLFPTIFSNLPPNRAKKKAEFHLKLSVKCQNLTEKGRFTGTHRNPPEPTGNWHSQTRQKIPYSEPERFLEQK